MPKITIEMESPFSGDELQQKAMELAQAVIRLDELDEERKSQTAEIRSEQKDLRASTKRLAKELRTGKRLGPVECVVKFHTPATGTKRTIRLDTNETIREEPMTQEELQENLFGTEDELHRMYGDGPKPEPESMPSPDPASDPAGQPADPEGGP